MKIFLSGGSETKQSNNIIKISTNYYINARLQLMRSPSNSKGGGLMMLSGRYLEHSKMFTSSLSNRRLIFNLMNQCIKECNRAGYNGIILDFPYMGNEVYSIFSQRIRDNLKLYIISESDTAVPSCDGHILRILSTQPYIPQLDEFCKYSSLPKFIMPYIFSHLIPLPDLKNSPQALKYQEIQKMLNNCGAKVFYDPYLHTSFFTKSYKTGGCIILFDRPENIEKRIKSAKEHGFEGAVFNFPSVSPLFDTPNAAAAFIGNL